jgi:hypothetical protein
VGSVPGVTAHARLLRYGVVLPVAILMVGFSACGGEEAARTPTTRVDDSPAQVSTATPSATGFDEEAWRRETIRRFGDEPEFADGSKLDYVETARELCAQEQYPEYEEESLQAYMVETFCPNVGD